MRSRVERCELAPGLSISRVLTGLWQIADMERRGPVDLDRAASAMGPYVEAGLTTFDMADHYGSAEEIAGRFRSAHGDGSVELLTKWVPRPGPITRDDVRTAVQRSLDRMQCERLDLLQYHAWVYSDPTWLDGLFWLQELRTEGLVKQLGVTNVDTAHLRMILESGIDVVSNQVCFSLLDRRAQSAMTELCSARGVKLLAFGTVAGGFLTERWLDQPEPDRLDNWSLMKYKRFIDVAGGWSGFQDLLRALNTAAQRLGMSIANVACRYILDQPAVGGVVVGARLGESEHVADTLRVFEYELDDASRDEIGRAAAALLPIPGDCGDEYRRPPFLTASGDLSHHVDGFPAPYPTQRGGDGREYALSGTVWEDIGGYSRAVRRDGRVWVSGTTATHGDRLIGGSDPASQAEFVIDKVEGALRSLGAELSDVVRTRVYIRHLEDWEAVARVHGRRFGAVLPANTLVQAGLVGDYLVEIEAEAVVNDEHRISNIE